MLTNQVPILELSSIVSVWSVRSRESNGRNFDFSVSLPGSAAVHPFAILLPALAIVIVIKYIYYIYMYYVCVCVSLVSYKL